MLCVLGSIYGYLTCIVWVGLSGYLNYANLKKIIAILNCVLNFIVAFNL